MHDKKKDKKKASDMIKMILDAAKESGANVKVTQLKGEEGQDTDIMTHLHDHIDNMHEKVDTMHSVVVGLSMQMGSILETQKEVRDSMNALFKLFMEYADTQTKGTKKPNVK